MPQVQVVIAGRSYRMACGDGEEEHLQRLAAGFDGKIDEMRQAFGEIGEMRLHVMAALTVADELAETRRRVEALEAEVAAIGAAAAASTDRAALSDRRVAEAVARSAERIERLAQLFAASETGGRPGGAALS